MIWAFFVFGSVWFWTLLVIELVLLTVLVDAEETWWSFWSVIIFLGLIHLFGDANVFIWLKDHPWDVIRIVALYAILGIAWGVSKYIYNVNKVKSILRSLKPKFIEEWDEETARSEWVDKTFRMKRSGDERTVEDITNEWDISIGKNKGWKEYYEREINYKDQRWIEFGSKGQVGSVIFWMAYWPVSFFWTIFSDMLRSAARWFYYTCLVRIFENIHKKTVGKELEIE